MNDDGIIWPAGLAEWNPSQYKRSEWHYGRFHSIRRYGQQYNDPRPDIEQRELAAARAFQESEISNDQEARLRGQDRMLADLGITSGDVDEVRLMVEADRREIQKLRDKLEQVTAERDKLADALNRAQIDGGPARRWLGRSR